MKKIILILLFFVVYANTDAQTFRGDYLKVVDGKFVYQRIYEAENFPDEITITDIKINSSTPTVTAAELVPADVLYKEFGYNSTNISGIIIGEGKLNGSVLIERKDSRVRVTVTNLSLISAIMNSVIAGMGDQPSSVESLFLKGDGEIRASKTAYNSLDAIEKTISKKFDKSAKASDW